VRPKVKLAVSSGSVVLLPRSYLIRGVLGIVVSYEDMGEGERGEGELGERGV
jgi:hypothetical protein